MDEIAFEEGRLDELRRQLLTHEALLAYVRIGRIVRGDTTTDDTRINWTPDALSVHLGAHSDALAETPDEMAEALVTWLRRTIRNNWGGTDAQTWKIRGYGAKGETTLFSMRLQASQTGEPEPPPEPPGALITEARPPTESAWDALSRAYEQLGRSQERLSRTHSQFMEIALNWQKRLMSIATELQQQTLDHLNADRAHLRRHSQELATRLDNVLGEFSAYKVELMGLGLDAAGSGLQQQQSRQSQELNAKLGEKFLGTLGDLGSAYFTSQGLSPALSRLLKTLTDDPEINAVLHDPDLPGLLEDPQNRQMLASLLKQGLVLYRQQKQAEAASQEAARQAEEAKQTEASRSNTKPGETPGGQPTPDPPGGI